MNKANDKFTSKLFDTIKEGGDMALQINSDLYVYMYIHYGKWPKILYPKVSYKMAYANSADPDQTAPGAVWSGSSTVWHSTKCFKKQFPIKRNLGLKKYGIKC